MNKDKDKKALFKLGEDRLPDSIDFGAVADSIDLGALPDSINMEDPNSHWGLHSRDDLIEIIENRDKTLERLLDVEMERTLNITGVKHLTSVVVALTLSGYNLSIGLDLETTHNGEDHYGFIVTYVQPQHEGLRFRVDEF